MRTIYLIICLLGFESVYAHNPDLASFMLYQQDGKSILLIKSSLTAFEGEVSYLFGKDAYKTPEEFNQLVIKHFLKNCLVIANGDTLKFSNAQVRLGHETNLFAEVIDMPDSVNSLEIKNSVFSDMPNNQCEIILNLNGVDQKQHILNNSNNHEVKLNLVENKWIVQDTASPTSASFPTVLIIIIIIIAVLFVASLTLFLVRKRLASTIAKDISE